MTATPGPGVVARWSTRRQPAAGTLCDECGSALTATACRRCGQLAGRLVGMLATVVDTPAGAQLVIAERTSNGDWAPVRTLPATTDNVRALAHPGATGPAPDTVSASGALW